MATTGTRTTMEGMGMSTEALALLRLQSWLSPSFPTGGYAYSHGLEYAVEAGLVSDRASLVDWLDTVLRLGSGRLDTCFLVAGLRAAGDSELLALAELAAAMRGSAELGLETTAQGTAFLATVAAAWPHPGIDRGRRLLHEAGIEPALPIAVAIAAAAHGLPERPLAACYLQNLAANLVQAALRLLPLGQTDGQQMLAALEGAVLATVAEALVTAPETAGSAAPMIDWCSMRHETQYTRLFRS
jgi:urease accessory protein